MIRRAALLVGVLAVEALIASVYLDGETLTRKGGVLSHFVAAWGAWAVRGIIGFAALFATFAYLKHPDTLLRVAAAVDASPVHYPLLALHAGAIAIFAALSAALYGPATLSPDVMSVAWILAAVLAVSALAFAVAPYRTWVDLVRSTGRLWLYALAASIAACTAGALSWALWGPTTRLTYSLVQLFLSPFVADMVVQPERMRIGTTRFGAIITPECSGLEGAGLLVAFAVVWMVLFRDEVRFPQCLILIPAGVIILFVLNAVRIATLILIGDAGAREIAVGGFHSQAGWITFNAVAFGFSMAARRLAWFSVLPSGRTAHEDAGTDNPTAVYLIPFLAIIAAGMFSHAMAGNFEWFYSLRLFAALTALWLLRRSYARMDWSFGWQGVAIGVAVFGLWIGMEPLAASAGPPGGMPVALASASIRVQVLWIVLRVLSGVLTVPLAEELAFRGFVLRRLIAVEFETVSYRRYSVLSLVVSSVLFGLMHGDRWIVGTLAGVCYAIAAIRGGRLGDAVAAHATTNGLLACYVLSTGNWRMW